MNRFVFSLLLAALSLCSAQAPAPALLLQAQVEHSEKLQAVKAELAPGQIFDRANLPNFPDSAVANQWFRIPDWLAGKWHKDSQTDYYRLDFKTNQVDTTTRVEEAKSDGTWGTQIDPESRIWQFNPAPYTDFVDAGDQFVVQIVR
ncbi:MAG TPA: hypothetical protein V6C72_17175, partial [Chroococcales cyanobacterium]